MRIRYLMYFALIVVFACSGCASEKTEQAELTISQEKFTPPEISQKSNQHTASGVNPITLAAVQSGILSGASRINQITDFIPNKNPSSAFIFPAAQNPDKHIFSVSMEIFPDNALSVYATASFSPNLTGGWDAVYDTVEYIDQPMENVIAQVFAGIAPKKLGRDILLYEAGDVKFFLIPAGKGCVIIKKEVVR